MCNGIDYCFRLIWKILYRYIISIGWYENWIYRCDYRYRPIWKKLYRSYTDFRNCSSLVCKTGQIIICLSFRHAFQGCQVRLVRWDFDNCHWQLAKKTISISKKQLTFTSWPPSYSGEKKLTATRHHTVLIYVRGVRLKSF